MAGPNGAPYVAYTQLGQYMAAQALNLATMAQQIQACTDATETADSYLRGRYSLPLLAWGSDLTRYTAYIACYLLMAGPIGWSPQAGSDGVIKTNYYEAVGYPDRIGTGWFPRIQRQAVQPDVTPSIAVGQDPGHDLPQVASLPLRGWQRGNRIGGF
jgi:phage gp36-like protein